jgi:hypothetical protein
MKKVITSFGIGEHKRLLGLSIPTFYLYAQNHNYDVYLPNISFFNDDIKSMPPSWWKIDVIKYLFQYYDQVLWIDADVIICRFEEDIANHISNNHDFGVVVHETNDGQVPNCGVWFLNKSCLGWLDSLKNFNYFNRSKCWWEQASLLHLLGIDPDADKLILPERYSIPWVSLDYTWNPHINDHRKIPNDTKFFHATAFTDRYSTIKNILHQIEI